VVVVQPDGKIVVGCAMPKSVQSLLAAQQAAEQTSDDDDAVDAQIEEATRQVEAKQTDLHALKRKQAALISVCEKRKLEAAATRARQEAEAELEDSNGPASAAARRLT
jgi:hypothetical protein